MLARVIGTKPDVACLFPRAANAAVFIAHGLAGLTGGADTFSRSVGAMNLPGGHAWVLAAALVELVGGLFVGIGLFTRWSALSQAVLAAVSIYVLTRASEPFRGGWELDLAVLMTSLALVCLGPGTPSVERNVVGREL